MGLRSLTLALKGMACRLAIDIGLNLDCTMIDLPKRTIQVRFMVLWACVIYDT